MFSRSIRASLLPLLAFTAVATAAVDTSDPVLKGDQVTESRLIDALAIPADPTDPEAATRGFRAAKPGSAAPAKAGPGKASLLITFTTGSNQLTPEASRLVGTLGKALQSDTLAGFSFKVEGHADARGSSDANLKLSQERAQAVVDYLVANAGILPERLVAIGKGSSEPMNKARVDAPENRRVTIITVKN